jgi:hypothetical protein
MSSLRRVRAAAALAAVLSLAACNDSSTSDAKAGAAASGTVKAKPAAGGGAAKGTVHVCSVLPAAALAKITGKPFDQAKPDDLPAYLISRCSYKGGTGIGEQLDVTFSGKGGRHSYDGELEAIKAAGQPVRTVSGIGDRAFSGAGVASGMSARLAVNYGDVLIKISGFTELTEAQAKEIASRVHAAS